MLLELGGGWLWKTYIMNELGKVMKFGKFFMDPPPPTRVELISVHNNSKMLSYLLDIWSCYTLILFSFLVTNWYYNKRKHFMSEKNMIDDLKYSSNYKKSIFRTYYITNMKNCLLFCLCFVFSVYYKTTDQGLERW